jgi:hypothetical protein
MKNENGVRLIYKDPSLVGYDDVSLSGHDVLQEPCMVFKLGTTHTTKQ